MNITRIAAATTALALGAISLPAQAAQLSPIDKYEAIGAGAAATCRVFLGDINGAGAKQVLKQVLSPEANEWLTTATGEAAVQAFLPYLSDDCRTITGDRKKIGNEMSKYVF